MKKLLVLLMVLAMTWCVPQAANASLISLVSDLSSPTVIDFSAFSGGWNFTSGPVQIGGGVGEDITWSSTNSGSVIGDGGYGLAANGSWNAGLVGYTGLNTSFGTMSFNFNDGPVYGVGGFVNYAPGYGTPSLSAYGAGDSLLETYTLPDIAISTPDGVNQGQFFGILRGSDDITSFRLTNSYWVLDDLAYTRQSALPQQDSPTVVPEPASMFLFGSGLVGAFLRRRRS